MRSRDHVLAAVGAGAALLIVAGCTSGSDGNGAPSATATVTTTASASGATGAPITGTPVAGTPSATTTGGGSGTSGGGGTSASGPGLCTPTVMTFVVDRGVGAAGTGYFSVTATNASKQSCVTTGYPGIAFLDAANQQVLQAKRDTTGPVTTIVLAPGEQASAVVAAVNMGSNGAACPTSPAFLFTLPDNTDSTKLTHTTPICSVSVRAFVKGAAGA